MSFLQILKKGVLFCGISTFANGFAQGDFYREYWAAFDSSISNHRDGRWRVNDPELSLHEKFGHRPEARANGMMLLNVNEDLFHLQTAELYLELWGGHGGTGNKRFLVNGRGPYFVPQNGTEEGCETYSYPVQPIKLQHLVSGINAFQFTCEHRQPGRWGHFIIDNACIRATLKPDHPTLVENRLSDFTAMPEISGNGLLGDEAEIRLRMDARYADQIEKVHYFGRYYGFDDDGDRTENDWHGFTFNRQWVNHVGSATVAPFRVVWDTRLLPDQAEPMAVIALIQFKNGIIYRSPILPSLVFPKDRPCVRMFRCNDLPVPFHSRINKLAKATWHLPDDLNKAEQAQLWIKTWDGGEGTVKQPFTINGHAYNVISGKHIHDVVFTSTNVVLDHLQAGENRIALLSDTEHHGIEILLPGPCLIVRYKK